MNEDLEYWKKRWEEEQFHRKAVEEQLHTLRKELDSARQSLLLGVGREWKTSDDGVPLARNLFDKLVEHATDVIYQVDENGYFNLVNTQAVKQFGYNKENLLGRHFSEFVASSHREKVYEYYVMMRDQGVEKTYLEFPALIGNGDEIWIGQNVTRIIADDGTVNFTAIARDITEKYHKEQTLRSFATMVTALVTNIIAALVIENQNQEIVITNPTFCNLFGIEAKSTDLSGTNFPELLDQLKIRFKNPGLFIHHITSIIEKKNLRIGEEFITEDDRTILMNFIPIVSGEEYFGNLWYFEDISTRKNKELQIKRSEEKYRGIVENMEFGILEVDPEGFIIRAYDRFCKLTGYREEELLGQNAIDLLLPPQHRQTMMRNDEYRKKGISNVYESDIITKSGDIINVLIGGAPFYDENGQFIGSIGIHYDITLQKQLQAELEKARQEAEKARDAEKEFLANMSHEIRNPINTILGVTHLLVETPLSRDQQDLITSLRNSSEILHALVNDILDISKITEGKYELNKKNFNLLNHIQTVANSFLLPIQSKGLTLEPLLGTDLQIDVYEDKTVFSQILINLFTNAVKFTNQGSIHFSGQLLTETDSQYTVKFSISDTGIGIPKDRIHTIFDRFNQAGKAIQSQYGGTGLGLSICQKLIEMHDGKIQVESSLNQGTTFTFQMKFNKALPEKSTDEFIFPIATEKLHGVRVLIVEDNTMNQQYLSSLFHKLGILTQVADHGLMALDLFEREAFDLVLMDIRMPAMDGYETTRRLRSMSGNPNQHIPIIALTASALKDEKEKALANGMNYHLTKPFIPEQIIDLMLIACSQSEREKTALEFLDKRKTQWTVQELYDGDWDHYYLMIDLFTKNIPIELEEVDLLFQSKNMDELIQRLHKIKPSFAMIGYPAIAKEIEIVESHLEQSRMEPEKVAAFIRQLKEKTRTIIDHLAMQQSLKS